MAPKPEFRKTGIRKFEDPAAGSGNSAWAKQI
jgi:hypothetical protein